MPKYDAFGREIGENTLSGLGGDEQASKSADWEARIAEARAAAEQAEREAPEPVAFTGAPQVPAAPEPEPEPVVFTGAPQVPIAPPPQPSAPKPPPTFSIPKGIPSTAMPRRAKRGSGGLGCLVGLLILGAVLIGPIIAIVSFVGDTSDTVRRAIDDATRGVPADNAGTPPQGLGPRSMIRAANLTPALRTIQAQNRGKLGGLTVRADRVDATLITRRSREQTVLVLFTGEVQTAGAHDVGIAQDTIPWDAIDPKAPQRLARAGAGKAGADDINYVIARPPTVFDSGKVTWIAYYAGGRIVQGDAHGKPTRRIS